MRSRRIYLNKESSHYRIYENGKVINTDSGKEIKFWINSHGRYETCLSHKGKKYFLKRSRLLALYFLPNAKNLPEVDHIDGDKTNDSLENLEWVTSEENLRREHALRSYAGENCGKSVLNDAQVHEICKKIIDKIPLTEIAKEYGITKTTICDIKNKKTWNHITHIYKDLCLNKSNYEIEEICKQLSSNVNETEIIENYDITKKSIDFLKSKYIFKKITNKYFTTNIK